MQFKIIEDKQTMAQIPVTSMANFIKKNCQPVLRELNSQETPPLLYRGIKSNDPIFIGTVRKNRRPKDTGIEYHNLFNNSFFKLFGWKPRSEGLFVSGEVWSTKSYGDTYIIFPMGDFKFIYSPNVIDLYVELQNITNYDDFIYKLKIKNKAVLSKEWREGEFGYNSKQKRYGMIKKYPEIMNAFIKGEYTDKNFIEGILSRTEIMINCDKYVAIEKKFYNDQKFSDFLFSKPKSILARKR